MLALTFTTQRGCIICPRSCSTQGAELSCGTRFVWSLKFMLLWPFRVMHITHIGVLTVLRKPEILVISNCSLLASQTWTIVSQDHCFEAESLACQGVIVSWRWDQDGARPACGCWCTSVRPPHVAQLSGNNCSKDTHLIIGLSRGKSWSYTRCVFLEKS